MEHTFANAAQDRSEKTPCHSIPLSPSHYNLDASPGEVESALAPRACKASQAAGEGDRGLQSGGQQKVSVLPSGRPLLSRSAGASFLDQDSICRHVDTVLTGPVLAILPSAQSFLPCVSRLRGVSLQAHTMPFSDRP
jgi:hypothetical protein